MAKTRKPPRRRSAATGRFRAAYDPLRLYEIVRAVAQVAAYATSVLPWEVTERAWDAARAPAGYPGAPPAREVCRQVRPRGEQRLPWRDVLWAACRPQSDERHHSAAQRQPRDERFTVYHVIYALRLVAHSRGAKWLLPHEYAATRDQLIRADQARYRHGGHLGDCLPTEHQIVSICDDWDRALAIAGLEPRPVTFGRASGLPIAEAIVRFYRETGFLPTGTQLTAYARDRGFALANREPRPWAAQLEDGKQLIAAAGLDPPPPYRPRHDKPEWPKAAPTTTIVTTTTTTPSAPAAANGEAAYRPKHWWSRARMLTVGREFLRLLPAGRAPSTVEYKKLRDSRRSEWPATVTISATWPCWRDFIRDARSKTALAEAQAAEQRQPTAEELAAEKQARLERRLRHPTVGLIQAALADATRPLGSADIAAAIGISQRAVVEHLAGMVDGGLITPIGNGKLVTYADTQTLAQGEIRAIDPRVFSPRARALLAAITTQPRSISELARETGMHRDWAARMLRRLEAAGMVNRASTRPVRYVATGTPPPTTTPSGRRSGIGPAETAQGRDVLAALRQLGGEAYGHQLAAMLGWSHPKTNYWLRALTSTGHLIPLATSGSPAGRYRLSEPHR